MFRENINVIYCTSNVNNNSLTCNFGPFDGVSKKRIEMKRVLYLAPMFIKHSIGVKINKVNECCLSKDGLSLYSPGAPNIFLVEDYLLIMLINRDLYYVSKKRPSGLNIFFFYSPRN